MTSGPIVLDTSFLITYASSARPNHGIAKLYFDEMIRTSVPMMVPTIVVAEFERRQRLDTLGLQNFRILPFNFDDAVEAALIAERFKPAIGDRLCLAADFKIVAQAHRANAKAIITEDASTMAPYVNQLRLTGYTNLYPILLSDGFDPALVIDPSAPGLPLV